ncbi:MAG: hypothetical protein ACK4WH_11080 [Phycisphaerales bacterium]
MMRCKGHRVPAFVGAAALTVLGILATTLANSGSGNPCWVYGSSTVCCGAPSPRHCIRGEPPDQYIVICSNLVSGGPHAVSNVVSPNPPPRKGTGHLQVNPGNFGSCLITVRSCTPFYEGQPQDADQCFVGDTTPVSCHGYVVDMASPTCP